MTSCLHDPELVCIGIERFDCDNAVEGPVGFDVPVFRFAPFARVIELPEDERLAEVEMVLLPPPGHDGRFVMGSPVDEDGHQPIELQREVRIEEPFLLACTAVSVRVLEAHGGAHHPWGARGLRHPAAGVLWTNAVEWCAQLGLRLPTEPEWEFACRAGTGTPFCYGAKIDERRVHCNNGMLPGGPVDCGSLPPNAFGLHEMHGNVPEWVDGDPIADPLLASAYDGVGLEGQLRILRGGGWYSLPELCRAAYRGVTMGEDQPISYTGVRPARPCYTRPVT